MTACMALWSNEASWLLSLPYAGVRPVPLEIHIMAFDIVSFDARLQAMARPTYSGLVQASSQVRVCCTCMMLQGSRCTAAMVRALHSVHRSQDEGAVQALASLQCSTLAVGIMTCRLAALPSRSSACLQNQSSIVFVPTRKHARLTAMDILGYASADGLPKRFLAVHKLLTVNLWALPAKLRSHGLHTECLHDVFHLTYLGTSGSSCCGAAQCCEGSACHEGLPAHPRQWGQHMTQ